MAVYRDEDENRMQGTASFNHRHYQSRYVKYVNFETVELNDFPST